MGHGKAADLSLSVSVTDCLFLSLSVSVSVSGVCVCVCELERERERGQQIFCRYIYHLSLSVHVEHGAVGEILFRAFPGMVLATRAVPGCTTEMNTHARIHARTHTPPHTQSRCSSLLRKRPMHKLTLASPAVSQHKYRSRRDRTTDTTELFMA